MPNRISLKGKGAAIFFGEEPREPSIPSPALATQRTPDPLEATTPAPDVANASSPTIPASHVEHLDDEHVRTDLRPSGRPPETPIARAGSRRTTTRYAFEFFQDQVEALQRLALEQKVQGEKGSMSEMVREAIDEYLAKRRRR
ncbi:MAG: hypothetical protein ACR2PL_14805 [Dehalococcoidia bacterium]